MWCIGQGKQGKHSIHYLVVWGKKHASATVHTYLAYLGQWDTNQICFICSALAKVTKESTVHRICGTGQKAYISDSTLVILPTLGSGTQIGFVVFVVHRPR